MSNDKPTDPTQPQDSRGFQGFEQHGEPSEQAPPPASPPAQDVRGYRRFMQRAAPALMPAMLDRHYAAQGGTGPYFADPVEGAAQDAVKAAAVLYDALSEDERRRFAAPIPLGKGLPDAVRQGLLDLLNLAESDLQDAGKLK